MTTIVAKIDVAESNLSACHKRLDEINKTLRRDRADSDEHKSKLKEESEHLHSLVKCYEKEIAILRRENRKSMLVSVFIFVLFGLIYLLYSTYYSK